MKAIVFSRDRPMQLDLLLTSLERNAPGLFDVTVIWYSHKEDFQAGYAICEREHTDAHFMREDGLTYQVRSLILDQERLLFFTDDDVLYRPLAGIPDLYVDWICCSLRLGGNTTYCYPLDREQPRPLAPDGELLVWPSPHGELLIWPWEQYEGDFGYPMSLDGHIFRGQDLLPILHTRHFSNPNWLEEILMREARTIDRPLMSCFHESHLVGLPLNRVNTTTPNRHGGLHFYSVQELNDRYLRGERVDLGALDFSDIRGAHQEIALAFR